jgi:hypothetical protein
MKRGLCALLSTTLVWACFPSFGFTSDAGSDGGTDRLGSGCPDAHDCSHPGDASHEAAGDAASDASSCFKVAVIAPPAHGGAACPMDGSACYPGDVTKFVSKWVPPITGAPYANQCTKKQIANAYANCFGASATTSGCMQWEGANPGCLHCMVTDSTAPQYGPVLFFFNGANDLTALNVAGCIYLAEPCNLPCAEATLADLACDFAACTGPSSPCAAASNTDVVSCISQADSTCGCMAYHTSQTCYLNLVDHPSSHPAVALCGLDSSGGFSEPNFTAIVTFMCGPPS